LLEGLVRSTAKGLVATILSIGVLMEVSASIICRSAQTYHEACERLRTAPSNQEAMKVGYPCIYMAVMASELYLKAMVYRVHKNVPRHHDLTKLFNALPADIKAEIVRLWDERVHWYDDAVAFMKAQTGMEIDSTFLGALRGASKANESLRYIWEGKPEGYTILQDLPRLMQDVIQNYLGWAWLEGQPQAKGPPR
jgi:HEPN domain-containing protein